MTDNVLSGMLSLYTTSTTDAEKLLRLHNSKDLMGKETKDSPVVNSSCVQKLTPQLLGCHELFSIVILGCATG